MSRNSVKNIWKAPTNSIIDIYQQPKLAKGEQIIATPTLIKQLPLPLQEAHRRHVGYGKISCRD